MTLVSRVNLVSSKSRLVAGRSRNVVSCAAKRPASPLRKVEASDPVSQFLKRLQLAWEILFPPPPVELSAKDEVKRRLRMVLVADRCGLSPGAMTEMKTEIVDAIRKYVDIKGDEEVEVNVSMDPEMGTVYSVNIPVKRVKAIVRQNKAGGKDDITVEWNEEDWNADPSSRFPMGA